MASLGRRCSRSIGFFFPAGTLRGRRSQSDREHRDLTRPCSDARLVPGAVIASAPRQDRGVQSVLGGAGYKTIGDLIGQVYIFPWSMALLDAVAVAPVLPLAVPR